MVLRSEEFNKKIGHCNTILEMQKLGITYPDCNIKIQKELDKIQEYLENGAEMGFVLP